MAGRLLTHQVVGTSFAFYTDEEIRKLSVKAITNPQTFDANNLPMDNGLYDKALGPTDYPHLCPTCGLTFQECPGHMGHVELCVPVYNPTLFPLLYRLLRLKCYSCHHMRIPSTRSKILAVRLMLLDCGRLNDAMELETKLVAPPAEGKWSRNAEEHEGLDDAEIEVARQAKLLDDIAMDCIAQAGPDVGCGLGADGGPARFSAQIRSYRDEILGEYLRSAPPKACGNCGALALPIRKDGYSKLFQKPLSRAAAFSMAARGVRYTSATAILRARARAAAKRARRKEAAAATAGGAEAMAEDEQQAVHDDVAETLDDQEDLFGNNGGADGEDGQGGADEAGQADSDGEDGGADSDPRAKPRYMPASEVAAQMQLLWEEEAETLRRAFLPVRSDGALARASYANRPKGTAAADGQRSIGYGGANGWRHFFLRVLPVPAARFRPPTHLGDQQYEHPQNVYLSKILRLNDTLVDLGLGTRPGAAAPAADEEQKPVDLRRAITTWMELQNNVNGLLDSSKAGTSNGSEPANGIRQLLEKKAGLFRQNMMGKRVNYAARTVISPDPFLRTDQVGVPLRFAKRLHFKQPVTPWNVEEMRRLVTNGAHVWPGATHVEDEFGQVTDLARMSKHKREALAKTLLTSSQPKNVDSELHGPANPLSAGFSVTSGSASTGGGLGLSGSVMTAADLDPSRAVAAAAAGALKGVGVKRVWRHLQDGDIVLMNRQPTLHKPSIMAHRARVMKNWPNQQILRFHYANCKTFNADFDGDEMNMHLPQDELARAEAYTIAAAPYQYLSATGGGPLRGLIQDHNSIAVILTRRDHLLTRDQYCQLVFAGLQALPQFGIGSGGSAAADGVGLDGIRKAGTGPSVFDVPMLPPAVLKPRPMWTGKQVISALLKGLTAHMPPNARGLHYDGKSKIGEGLWGSAKGRKDVIPVGESTLTVRSNEMLTGVLDKSALGNSSYGLIHAVYEVHGPQAAAALLSAFGRLLTVYLQWASVTCGIEDLMLDTAADAQRVKLTNDGRALGAKAGAVFAGVTVDANTDTASASWNRNVRRRLRDKLRGGAAGADVTGAAALQAAIALDNAVKSANAKVHGGVIDACLPYGFLKQFPANQFSLMVASGAKGSTINHAMIAVGLGQQELEGRRVPFMASGKTLPCFPAFDPAPRAGGYIADRFLTGLRPAEYFFHCMSGREGLVDTAVKTSRSGYLQRCLVKHLESLRVHYDYSVRDADGGLVQPCYGEDGLDILNTPYLQGSEGQLAFLSRNFGALSNQYGMNHPSFKVSASAMAGETATRALQLHTETLLSARALSGPTASLSVLSRVVLAKGTQVKVRLPARSALGLPALDRVYSGSEEVPTEVTVDGSKAFTAAALTAGLVHGQPVWVSGRIVKVRAPGEDEEAGSRRTSVDGVTTYDIRFSVAVAKVIAAVVIPTGTGKGKAKGKGKKKSADSDDEDEGPTLMDVDSGAGASADATTSHVSAAPGGVQYAVVRVLAKRVPLLAVPVGSSSTQPAATGMVILQPSAPEPLMSIMRPSTTLGVYGESLRDKIESFAANNPGGVLRKALAAGAGASSSGKPLPPGVNPVMSDVAFKLLMSVKTMRSLVNPGEPVGVIAAQSIGEPSTQMTLNTFHLAGGGGVNVTLGIPRLREIVMTASTKPKTPQMTLPLHASLDTDATRARDIAGRIARLLSPLPMSDLLATSRPDGGIRVGETLRQLVGGGRVAADDEAAAPGAMWVREYSVRLFLADTEAIAGAFGLSFMDVAEAVGRVFAPRLLKIIQDDTRKADRAASVGVAKAPKAAADIGARAGREDDEDGPAEAEDDGGNEGKKKRRAKAAKSARAADNEGGDDDDDEDEGVDDDENAAGDEDGTLNIGVKKTTRDYGDDDDEAEADADDDGASVSSGSSSSSSSSSGSSGSGSSSSSSSSSSRASGSGSASESDSDDGFVRRKGGKAKGSAKDAKAKSAKAKAAELAAKAKAKAGKDKEDKKPKGKSKGKVQFAEDEDMDEDGPSGAAAGAGGVAKGRLTAKRLAADRAARAGAASLSAEDVGAAYKGEMLGPAPAGTMVVSAPDSLTKNPRFGGILACPSGTAPGMAVEETSPWVEMTIVFPASARKVLMLSSAERASASSMVRQVAGITRALVTRQKVGPSKTERTCVMTEGQAIPAVWRLAARTSLGGLVSPDELAVWAKGGKTGSSANAPISAPFTAASEPLQPVLDVARLSSNDIAAMLTTYGVEACRAALVRELRNVFDAYGIGVDIRHLYLIGDYMTQHGGFRPMNRAGIDGHGSPFLKMSFETTAAFLTHALLRGEADSMTSPSARIAFGRPVDAGTGSFSLWTDMNKAAGVAR